MYALGKAINFERKKIETKREQQFGTHQERKRKLKCHRSLGRDSGEVGGLKRERKEYEQRNLSTLRDSSRNALDGCVLFDCFGNLDL